MPATGRPEGIAYRRTMTEAELALWERSRSLANFHLHAVAMQIDRIRKPVGRNEEFVLRPVAEFQFLCVSHVRLRRAAALAATIPAIQPQIQSAIASFDGAIPRLATLRNVAEHFDDYLQAKGRDKSLTPSEFRSGLQVSRWSESSFCWFDVELKFDDCLAAAYTLFRSIKQALE
jgi:hypothetical protein